MFILRTGLQGNGKTLNTIKEVDTKAHAEGRVVYYCNITGFKPDHPAIKAKWLEFDFPERWFDLPSNSIIVIDEGQTWFRVRPQGSKVPDFATRLEIMRKDGHELHVITQSPKLIDSHMRQLCNGHIHYSRGHGGPVIKRWVFQHPEITVNDGKLEFANGESSRITIDKTYFGCYESVKEGSGHHFKFRPPKALILLAVCLLLIAGLSYRFYTNRLAPSANASDAPSTDAFQPVGEASTGSFVDGALPLTPEQYIESRIPRVPDSPSSAPIYDQVTQAVSYPKTFCVSSKDQQLIERASSRMTLGYKDGRLQGCRCNTQQGSKVDISFDVCMATVENGFFDPAKPDKSAYEQQANGSVGAHEERGATAEPLARSRQGMQVTVINSGKPGHLW